MEITLLTKDELGCTRSINISSSRFTVGRSQGNDLVIDDPHLSRRQSLIETFDDTVQVSDCGSQNGTFVNGTRVSGACVLKDGDEISFGELHWFVIRIVQAQTSGARIGDDSNRTGRQLRTDSKALGGVGARLLTAPQTSAGAGTKLNAPLIAGVAAFLLAFVTLLALLLSQGSIKTDSGDATNTTEPRRSEQAPPASPEVGPEVGKDTGAAANPERIDEDVMRVIRTISSDPNPTLPPPQALDEIRAQIEQYRNSPMLPPLLSSMKGRVKEVTLNANRAGLTPSLVIWMSLAMLDGGRAGQDPVPAYRSILRDLPRFTTLFGTDNADRALLLVAAYRVGPGKSKSHPLLERLPGVKDPFADVNVWYLHDQKRLQPEAYSFVIKFLALGMIARDPGKFRIEAPPVTF